jgi:dTDP-4-amino-4,6-dideoxygalactose transaminase
VEAFERQFAREIGAAHVVGVGSGTDALELALRALGIGAGDTVITASHTAVATVSAVERAGAQPLLVDIDPVTFTLDPDRLEQSLRLDPGRRMKVRAVVPVHLYGHPADMPTLLDVARRHDLRVIEDCAQSHGATVAGRTTGVWGDIAAFSFYPTKNLGAIGDGGVVATNNASLAERVRALRQYGWRQRYISDEPGLNSRLDELQAAILRVKCAHLRQDNQRRRALARLYADGCLGTAIVPPEVRPGVEHAFHQYVVRTPRRDRLRHYLQEKGVPTAIHYPRPVHMQPAYQGRVAIGAGGLAESERACREVLSLPMHPHLAEQSVQYAVRQIAAWQPLERG